jgi:hypothetical protein
MRRIGSLILLLGVLLLASNEVMHFELTPLDALGISVPASIANANYLALAPAALGWFILQRVMPRSALAGVLIIYIALLMIVPIYCERNVGSVSAPPNLSAEEYAALKNRVTFPIFLRSRRIYYDKGIGRADRLAKELSAVAPG